MFGRAFSHVVVAVVGLAATTSAARAEVCVAVDTAHDSLSSSEQAAAVLVIRRQFRSAGEADVDAPCASEYVVTHVRLGNTIDVELSGPSGHREARALGLDDLPAIYNQMVRSLLTGEPMNLRGVVDRTNVSAVQANPLRVGADSVFYARLGYGAMFAGQTVGVPSVGLLGYRHELDSVAVDVSFLNFQMNNSRTYTGIYDHGDSSSSASWLKLEALYFTKPAANESPYVGGGLSWGAMSLARGSEFGSSTGLQGEVTAGYEIGRASSIRTFFQVDASLPFYTVPMTAYSIVPAPTPRYGFVTAGNRYAPTLSVSVGLGWQRGGHHRP